jgi:uncharacterized repeat protein (TIGR01451 family)
MFRRLNKRAALTAVLVVAVAGVALAVLDSTRALPESEPNGTVATADPIDVSPPGEFVEGTISPAGDVDIFSFAGSNGDRIWALVDSGNQTASPDSVLALLNAAGGVIISDNDSGTGTGGDDADTGEASLLAGETLGATATFHLRVTEDGSNAIIDPYVLYAVQTDPDGADEDENNDDMDEAQGIIGASGETAVIDGQLNDDDWFSVEAQAGDRIFVAVRNQGDLDITVTIWDEEDPIATADSTGDNDDEGLAIIAPVTGTYFIELAEDDSAARAEDEGSDDASGEDGDSDVTSGEAEDSDAARGDPDTDYLLMATNLGTAATPTPTPTSTNTPTPTATNTPTPTATNTPTPTATNTPTPTATETPTPTATETPTPTATETPTPTATATNTPTPTATATNTPTPTATNTPTPTATATNTPTPTATPTPLPNDLSIEKQGPAEIPAGEQFDYVITVTNNGSSTVTEFEVTDTLPSGGTVGTIDINPDPDSGSCDNTVFCDLELTLDPGDTATITIPFAFAPDTEDGSEHENTATVSSANDPEGDNNEDSVTTTVVREADLEVTKTANREILFGEDFTDFQVTVTNNGPSIATNVVLTDILPPGFDDWFFHSLNLDYNCSEEDGTITCARLTAMDPGEEDFFSIHVAFTWGTPNGDLVNTASVESVNTADEGDPSNATADPDLTNNSDSASVRYITPLLFSLGPTVTSTIPAYGTGAALPVADEDIIAFDGFEFSILWDGSDVGIGAKLDAFAFTTLLNIGAERGLDSVEGMDILMSFSQNMTIPAQFAVGGTKLVVADADIVVFHPESLGSTTEGLFELFFDASDIGLTTVNEDIDAIDIDWDFNSGDRGFQLIDLFISTEGTFSASGQTGLDEDIFVCTDLQQGPDTACASYEKAFDGSDVGLGSDSEDVNALAALFDQELGCSVRGDCAGRGGSFDHFADLMLVTKGIFSVTQTGPPPIVNGANEDVLICFDAVLGVPTECGGFAVYFDGSDFGLATKELMNIEFEFFLFDEVICSDQQAFGRAGLRGSFFCD